MAGPDCWGWVARLRGAGPGGGPPASPAPLGARAPAPPRAPQPGGSPRLTAGRSVRAASRVAASQPGPRTLRPGPEQPPAWRGGTREEGGKEGAGRKRRSDHTRSGPERGAGRGGEGGPGRKLPQEGALLRTPGRRLSQGPPAPAPPPPPPRPGSDHPSLGTGL